MMPGLRRWIASLNTAVTFGLLGVLFIMGNYLSSRHYGRWDFTRQKLSTLSDQTVRVLKDLREPVQIVVFYQPKEQLYGLVTDLVEEYARRNPLVKVERVDPDQDRARAIQLAQQLQISDLNVVVFQIGARHKYVSDTDLADYDYATPTLMGEPRVKAFKGEAAFTSAMISLTQAASPRVWVTAGHGEKALDAAEPSGLAKLKKALEQQNLVVEPVTLPEHATIPAETKLVLIPGPTRRFTDGERALLQAYLEQGGRILVLADPMTDTGLEDLLTPWGVVLDNDVVVDPARQLPFVSAANLLVTTYTQHPVVEKMKTLMLLFPLARSVRPAPTLPPGVTVTPLALTSEKGWGDTDTSADTFTFTEGRDLKGPISVAVAVERRKTATEPGAPREARGGEEVPGRDGAPARLIVVGDSDFVSNAQLDNIGNRDFALSAVYWLLDQEHLIGIGPKTVEALRLQLTREQLVGAFWLCFAGLPLLLILLGVSVWWVRRR